MILQMYGAIQDNVAPGMGTCDCPTGRMVAEMLAMEVLLEVASRCESFQSISSRKIFVPKVKDILSGFAFNWETFRTI